MKLTEISSLKLEPVPIDYEATKLMYLGTKKKANKAIKEFIEYCNELGYVPVNPHHKWRARKKLTEVVAFAVHFGVENAKRVKVIEKTNSQTHK